MHWATQYIGRPWGPPGSGLSCWEFARHVLATHYAAPLPELPDEALRARDWQRVATITPPADVDARDGDVLLLRATRLHCGVVVHAGRRLGLLHADGEVLANGKTTGGVVWQPIADALAPYLRAELWRRHVGP